MRAAHKSVPAYLLVAVVLLAVMAVGCDGQSGVQQSTTSTGLDVSAGTGAGICMPLAGPRVVTIGCDTGAPVISGTPPANILVGAEYNFQPTMRAASKLPLTFDIQNKPRWATFDASTGSLTGVPSVADVGTYQHIQISATNGLSGAALPEFSIAVTQTAAGSVMVSWVPPTTNSNGTPITNLAGYQISYGTNPAALLQIINVGTAGLTNYLIDNLTPGTWYFTIEAVNSQGATSSPSAAVAVTVAGS